VSRHTVRLQNIVVGWSDLEDAEPELGRARGLFRPGVGYELVEPVFRLYTEAIPEPGHAVTDSEKLDRYHRARDELALSLEDDSGRVIPTSGIHIADYSHRRGGHMEIEVLIADRGYWGRRDG